MLLTGGRQGPSAVDESFDRYARMVRWALGVPVALVSLVEPDRQVFVGADGLPAAYDLARETPLSHSFCQWVVLGQVPLIIDDARLHPWLWNNPAICDLGVVAYAGHPITDDAGRVIGSLCAIDDQARTWDEASLGALADLAAACSAELAQRRLRIKASRAVRGAEQMIESSTLLLSLSRGLNDARTSHEVAEAIRRVTTTHLGCHHSEIWIRAGRPDAVDLPSSPSPPVDRSMGPVPADVLAPTTLERVELPEPGAVVPTICLDRSHPVADTVLSGDLRAFTDRAALRDAYPHPDLAGADGERHLFLPLGHRGPATGALVLAWREPGAFSDDMLACATALAAYTAQALERAHLLQTQHQALHTLQTSLLPTLPVVAGLQLAARYQPAASGQVGGDWFDAVELESGATSLMIGDVVGHDISAAAAMGQLRSTLRTLVWAVEDEPSRQVQRLDKAMEDLGVGTMASLVHAVLSPPDASGSRTLRWTSAGHPPPLLVSPDGTATFLGDQVGDVMLGVLAGSMRSDQSVELPPSSTLLLYTDGLIERRGEDLQTGLARLRCAAASHADQDLEDFLDGVLGVAHVAGLVDDIAVLAVRLT